MLHNMRPDISFIAIDPLRGASILPQLISEEGHLLDNLVAAGSKDNHLVFNKSSRELDLRHFGELFQECVPNSFGVKDHSLVAFEKLVDDRPEFPIPTRIERVFRAMTDMFSRVTDHINSPAHPDFDLKNPPASLADMDRIAKAMRALYPVKHITLAGNALFALSVEKMRTAGVEISVDCVEFSDRTLKSILKDKKEALWASTMGKLTAVPLPNQTGESMVQVTLPTTQKW